ncbi:MAG TPA: CDF family Co(II)/Ni(II) efflux transporter DmeF [Rhodocyclaceae bacterium]|nr:CDF family Co(II)/Ni(II) efflux transporter DmeF [Rhodocyclaceae bacterium]
MHRHDSDNWTPPHLFNEGNAAAERGTRAVMIITLVMMVVEIAAGWWFNSMALLADGWHMSSHALAIGLSAFAYAAARRYGKDHRFAFGTWKIEVLASFASALFLIAVALLMVTASVERLVTPQVIRFNDAIIVAIIGLIVNLICARLLHDGHDPQHHAVDHHDDSHCDHDEHHHHDHAHHHDLNLKSAYVHVLADAATSVLAIVALFGGKLFGWNWLDPVMGLVGATLVAVWAWSLLRDSASVLLDREMDRPVVQAVRDLLNDPVCGGDIEIADLHIWRVGRAKYACIMGVITHRNDLTPDVVKAMLANLPELYHVTVEINVCGGAIHSLGA